MNIDTTKLQTLNQIIEPAEVISIPAGASPKPIIVELPGTDGARVFAHWTGFPSLTAGDFVAIQRRTMGALQYVIVGTSGGTATSGGAAASETVAGVAELATQAETDAGTDDLRIVTPLKLANASTVARARNIFINGNFDVWQRTTNDTGVTTAVKYVADRWYAITGAGTLANVQRSTTVRTGALSKYSLEMVGAASVTVVNIGQRIRSTHSGRYKRTIAFSGYIFNGSGAAFTPILYALTPNAVDNWLGSAIRNGGGAGESLQSCADNAWTKVTWSADTSGYTNIDNGLAIVLEIPSGSLVAGDTVRFAEMNLVPGTGFPPIQQTDLDTELPRCQPYYYKTFPYGTAPAQNAGVAGAIRYSAPLAGAAAVNSPTLTYPSRMIASPTVTLYNPSAANAQVRDSSAAADCSGSGAAGVSNDGAFAINATGNAGTAVGNALVVHVTSSAEI